MLIGGRLGNVCVLCPLSRISVVRYLRGVGCPFGCTVPLVRIDKKQEKGRKRKKRNKTKHTHTRARARPHTQTETHTHTHTHNQTKKTAPFTTRHGSYKSTGVGSQTPPFRVSPDGQTTPRRREKVSRIVSHARRPLSRTFPAPSLSLSLAFRGRTPALHTARPTAARSGGCGVSSKRRACMGRSLVLEPISRAGNADAPKRREGFAIAQRGATGRQNNGRTDFFPAVKRGTFTLYSEYIPIPLAKLVNG